MPYQITSDNFDLSKNVTKLTEEKLAKLEKFVKDFGDDLKEVRTVINKGPRFGYSVKIELWVPNESFVAQAFGFNLEGVIDEAVEEIVRQVNKFKGKNFNKHKRLTRKFKKWLFSSQFKAEQA